MKECREDVALTLLSGSADSQAANGFMAHDTRLPRARLNHWPPFFTFPASTPFAA